MNKLIPFLLAVLIVISPSCSRRPIGKNAIAWNLSKNSGIVRMPQYTNKNGDTGGFYWSTYDATRRSSFIKMDPGRITVLAEVQPDAALELARSFSATANAKMAKGDLSSGDVNLQSASFQSIAELGKRTIAVNMQRDALYRLSEMFLNFQHQPSIYPKMDSMYRFAVLHSKDIALKEAEAEKYKSESDLLSSRAKFLSEKQKFVTQFLDVLSGLPDSTLSRVKKDSLRIVLLKASLSN